MITEGNRFFARLDVWDHTKKCTLAFRSKAMLQRASLEDGQEEEGAPARKRRASPSNDRLIALANTEQASNA